MTETEVLQLQQLYRDVLVLLTGADASFMEEMPLPVLAGMYGKRLRVEIERLAFWPTVHAGAASMLHPLSLVIDGPVADLFDRLHPLFSEHNRAFESEFLIGFMSDAGVRANDNAYNRALLQLSFRTTGIWTTGHSHFLTIRDGVQLLAFAEMMLASHGKPIAGWIDTHHIGDADLRRMFAYAALLSQVREIIAELPQVAQPLKTVEWLRDNMGKKVPPHRLDIGGQILPV